MKNNSVIIVTLGIILMELFVHAGTTDTGLKYLVRESAAGTTRPTLIIMLHGYGSNAEDLFGLAPEFPREMVVVSVQAPYTLSQGSYAWFHIDRLTAKPVYNSEEAEESRNAIITFIDKMKEKYHASDVYLLGFSQGAILSLSVGVTEPGAVNGIIALSGRILPGIRASAPGGEKYKKLRIFIGHGTHDEVIPAYNGQASALFCKNAGIGYTYKVYPIAHTISSPEITDILEWLKK